MKIGAVRHRIAVAGLLEMRSRSIGAGVARARVTSIGRCYGFPNTSVQSNTVSSSAPAGASMAGGNAPD